MFCRFVFDGTSSDEYGIMCVHIGSMENDYESQKTNLQTEKSINNNQFHIISQEYSEPITYKMQIINRDGSPISNVQERELNKWLCRRGKYKTLAILHKRYADTWFFANFNNPVAKYYNDVNGLEYTVTTNAPFAFSDERDFTVTFDSNDDYTKYVDNDEEQPIYPDMTITLKESGDLQLSNYCNDSLVDTAMIIKNCSAGEVFTINSKLPSISSSIPSHNVYNDFNKSWFYFTDDYNTIKTNLACTINFKYREYRKVALV
jgi:hypothetical protein